MKKGINGIYEDSKNFLFNFIYKFNFNNLLIKILKMGLFKFLNLNNLIINENYYPFFKKNNLLTIQSIKSLENPFFKRKKTYRLIQGFQIENLRFYLKSYFSNLEEGKNEWKNIQLLWQKGFKTAIPIFWGKDDKSVFIGTEEIKGRSCIELMKNNPEIKDKLIKEIAYFIAFFHKEGLFHQDCYLNHFYWDEKNKIILVLDLSRVIEKPWVTLKYQIKDLAQLAFSFETYLEDEAPIWWQHFLRFYEQITKPKFQLLRDFLIKIKIKLIKRHTKNLKLIIYK